MTAVMKLFVFREIQLFKVKYIKTSLIILTKQGSGEVLTQMIHCMMPHRNERNYCRNMIA